MRAVFQLLAILLTVNMTLAGSSILDKIKDDPELSQFYDLLERNQVALANLNLRAITLFAPTNEAFQSYNLTANSQYHVQYHMSTTAVTLDQLGKSIISDFDGNPPLYITKRRKNNQDYIWVNNALVIRSRSNVQMQNSMGKKQILHVIDEVLTPLTITQSSSLDVFNPDAFQFLTHADSLDIGGHRIRSYRQKVISNKKEPVFQANGWHTFFIPVEDGFKPHPRPDMIDKKVIDGHVISDQVVFIASAPNEEPFETLAFDDNIKVTISFFTQGEGKNRKTYVKSNTVVGDSKHSTGVVMAEIVRANIPVRNGVIHLIQRPLMIVDTTVMQFLEEKEDGPLFRFYETIMDFGGEFMQKVNGMKDVTLFAPSNEAWNDPNLKNIIRNKEKMKEILNLHIVRDRLNTERMRQTNPNVITQFPTLAFRKNLYFNVLSSRQGNHTITVEGGGVNATLIQADIAQTNGYVHIIDRVLGVPYSTVYDKLKTDPMLNSSNLMGMLSGFNAQLNDTTRRFTYFVPRDWAWQQTEIEFPSTHKKLFMPEFNWHARAILERHLVIADKVYTMAELKKMGPDYIVLPTARDALQVKVKEEEKHTTDPDRQGYSIFWNHRNIHIFRPDVECTNGIIHVIDHPFLVESDVQVTGGISHLKSTESILIANILMAFIAKLFV
ncbi:fasciclin-1 isoform X3 [Bradysia coprophila]|uniref:fasciclin-1 isoform X3 n=1 Tax=Bradysia coprophila TaxID=38358 RepID=UPI00187D7877|nr:fasciclin-1 isoform X3 [Bradysia coprophila]